jgi:hypothetical protein
VVEDPVRLEREQLLSLIARYAKEFADLARERGYTSLTYLLQLAAEQAQKDLLKASRSGESESAGKWDDRQSSPEKL